MNLTANIFLSFSYLLVNKLINNYTILKYRHNKYSTVVIPPCKASKIQPEEQTLRRSTNDKALVESLRPDIFLSNHIRGLMLLNKIKNVCFS